jgi:hypothetical protein
MRFRPVPSFIFLLLVAICPLAQAAAPPLAKVLVTTGSASEREGALYVAQDQDFFADMALT